MTPEQIDKEKADKVEKTKTIQPNKADLEETMESIPELGKSKPVDKTPPKESSRQYGKKVGDYNRVVEIAKEKGVDLNNVGNMPLMDSDKGKITEAVKSSFGRDLATKIQGYSDALTAPQNEERNKLDVKKLMEDQKRIRRARFADSLSAFGKGLQGKNIDPEQFASTRLVRQRDKQFQDFKDTTERNQKTKYLWEDKTRKEMIDFAEQESKNMKESEDYRQKMADIAAKNIQDQKNKDREFEETKLYHTGMLNKKAGSGGKDKNTVKIQTAQKTYELKPEQAAFYKGEILKKADTLRKKYPGWFTESQSSKEDLQSGKTILGPVTYKLNPEVSDTDMIRAYLENEELARGPKLNEEAYEKNKASYFDKYRKEKGLSTAPASQAAKPQTQKQAQPKSQYSTGGLY